MNQKNINWEKLLFVFINLIFSFCIPVFYIVENVSYWLSVNINYSDPVTSEQDSYYVSWIILFWLTYLLFKLSTFPIIYKLKNIFPFMNQVFERLKRKNHYRKTVLKKALILDAVAFISSIFLFIIYMQNTMSNIVLIFAYALFISLFWGCGVITSYLTLLFYFKIHSLFNKKKHLFYRAD